MAIRIPIETPLKTSPLRLRMEQAFRTSYLARRCVRRERYRERYVVNICFEG